MEQKLILNIVIYMYIYAHHVWYLLWRYKW